MRYNLALAYAKAGEITKALDELERRANDEPRLERWGLDADGREIPELQRFFPR